MSRSVLKQKNGYVNRKDQPSPGKPRPDNKNAVPPFSPTKDDFNLDEYVYYDVLGYPIPSEAERFDFLSDDEDIKSETKPPAQSSKLPFGTVHPGAYTKKLQGPLYDSGPVGSVQLYWSNGTWSEHKEFGQLSFVGKYGGRRVEVENIKNGYCFSKFFDWKATLDPSYPSFLVTNDKGQTITHKDSVVLQVTYANGVHGKIRVSFWDEESALELYRKVRELVQILKESA